MLRQWRLDELTDDKRLAKAFQYCLFMARSFVLRAFSNNPLVGPFVLAPNALPNMLTSVRLLQDQLFCNPPSRGGCVSWHQDYSYWTFSQPMGPPHLLDRPR